MSRHTKHPLLKNIFKLIIFLLLQVFIVYNFIIGLYNARSADNGNIIREVINVDDVDLIYLGKTENIFLVYDDTIAYRFLDSNSQEGSFNDLKDKINIGDDLVITYKKGFYTLSGKTNIVVDAHTDTENYRSIEAYNEYAKEVRITTIIIYTLIELVFLSIFVFIFFQSRTQCTAQKNTRDVAPS